MPAALAGVARAAREILGLLLLPLLLGGADLAAQAIDQPDAERDPLLAPQATETFHASHPDQLVWADEGLYGQLIDAIQGLSDHGLTPAQYHLDALLRLQPDRQARDRLATDAWLSAAAHLASGKLDPVSIEPDWTAGSRATDLGQTLAAALSAHDIANSLEQLAPTQPQYLALRDEYRRLRQQEPVVELQVPEGPILRAGTSGARVVALQQRLAQLELLTGDYQGGLMDAPTVAAVRLFQALQDLEPDALVGPATLAALNLGQQEKLDKLRVNLERWRWLPDDLGRRHLRVNIASFSITSWEDSAPVRTHLAIVGRTYRMTPAFSDEIEYLIFNPWWEVPDSIAQLDKLPLFRQHPELVTEQGFQVLDRDGQLVDPASIDWNALSRGNFPYRLRQEPGENNALGWVKIMFPNPHNVYLHDTPAQELFEQRQRAFSSGCIRTQFPLELARWLLAETPGWDDGRIESILDSGEETRVNLARRVPVHILYLTAVSEEGNGIRYLHDIYQRDARVLAGLLATHH